MKIRRAVKITVDVAMYGLMLALMSYPITRGLLRHGICGAAFVMLLFVHYALNLGWYRALLRGHQNARRKLLTATDVALLASSTALVASTLAMMGEVFSFAPFPMPWWGRGLHTTATAWTFVLASFHLGLHGQNIWSSIRRILGRAWLPVTLILLLFGASLFVYSGLWNDMLMTGIPKTHLTSFPLFLIFYLSITLFLYIMALYISVFTRKLYKNTI